MLSDKSIKQFKNLCEEEGLSLTLEQAQEEGNKLFRLFEIVYGSPLSKEEFESLKRNEAEQINN